MSDINKLVKALDNNDNENIMNLTTRKIMKMNLQILKELMLDRNTTINYLRKLKGYKFVDEINDLKHGSFIRWIPIIDPDNLPLTQCGMICDIRITDDSVIIVCKNFMHRHYTFKMDEVLIFQKLTSQEMVILSALDHLEKEQTEINKDKSDEEESDDEESDE